MVESTTRSFSDLPRIMWQRWYLTVAGLLVTLVLCGLGAMAVPIKYQAKAQVLLLPPKTSVGNGGNPYLALGGLQAAADVLARAMSDGDTYAKLRAGGITGSYTVARDLTTSGPVLLVAATNSTPDTALKTLQAILSQAEPRLDQLQDRLSVPANTRLSSEVFTQDSTAATQSKSQIRAILVALAAGLFLTVMLVSAGDSVISRRSRRRATSTAEPEVDMTGGSPGDREPAPEAGRSRRSRATITKPGARGVDTERLQEMLGDGPDLNPESADSEWSPATTEHAGRRGNV